MPGPTPPPDTLEPPPRRPHRGGVTILLLPDSGSGSRTWRISGPRLRNLRRLAWLAGALVIALALSWVALAWHASRTAGLQEELAQARAEANQVRALAASLEEVEASYARLRALFGDAAGESAAALFPSPESRGLGETTPDATPAPTTWPLTTRGFLTQPLLAAGAGDLEHPGIDVAVPSGSYIRAAGAGVVTDAGFDEVYGWFVRLLHADEVESLYAHAEVIVVEVGDQVLPGEVLGLTGSTGQSTAPHLHFELLANGVPLDPMAHLTRP